MEHILHPHTFGSKFLMEILPDQPLHLENQIVNILVMGIKGGSVDVGLLADIHHCNILQLLVFHELHQSVLYSFFGVFVPLVVFRVHGKLLRVYQNSLVFRL